jgi:hypothetical protein
MPSDIGGSKLEIQTVGGDLLLGLMSPEDPRVAALIEALAAQGRTPGDITLMGGGTSAENDDAGVAAILVKGADASALLVPLVDALLTDGSDAPTSQVTLGGKQVTRIAADPVLHAYATGDVIVVVNGPDAFLASYFSSLP